MSDVKRPDTYIRGSKFARNLRIREEIRDGNGQWKRIVSVGIAHRNVAVGFWRSSAPHRDLDVDERVRYRKARAGYGELR